MCVCMHQGLPASHCATSVLCVDAFCMSLLKSNKKIVKKKKKDSC